MREQYDAGESWCKQSALEQLVKKQVSHNRSHGWESSFVRCPYHNQCIQVGSLSAAHSRRPRSEQTEVRAELASQRKREFTVALEELRNLNSAKVSRVRRAEWNSEPLGRSLLHKVRWVSQSTLWDRAHAERKIVWNGFAVQRDGAFYRTQGRAKKIDQLSKWSANARSQ